MNSRPLRNGKGVNKPFRSPFANIKREIKCDTKESSTSKQLAFEASSPSKQLKLSGTTDETTIDKSTTANNDAPCIQDLEDLKKRIQEKEKKISDLKRSLVLRKKHNTEELKEDISKWTFVCQEALRDYQQEIQTKSSDPVNMTHILTHLGIPDDIVKYSKDDDTFN